MMTNEDLLPECLKRIRDQAQAYSAPPEGKQTLLTEWQSHVAEVRKRVPGVCVEQGGEALYLGKLSAGCRACKDGAWDCVFLTMECNLNCPFCWRPNTPRPGHLGSAFSFSPEAIADAYAQTRVRGVSFSGGEPFLHPARLLEWVSWFTSRFPDKYYWAYTNGLLVTDEILTQLAARGLDEIRFNLAASGYRNPVVLRNLAAAARRIPSVTVEIPAIPEDAEILLAALEAWCEAGAQYLNLHELVYEPGTNSAVLRGTRKTGDLEDGRRVEYNPESRVVTLAVMEKISKEGLPLGVNDCSLQSKVRQLRGRRRLLAPVVRSPHERLVEGDMLESCCAYSGGEALFFQPERLDEMRRRHPHHQFVRLARTAPLTWDGPGQWLRYEIL